MKRYLLLGILFAIPLCAMEKKDDITIKHGTDQFGVTKLVQDSGTNTDVLFNRMCQCIHDHKSMWVEFPQGASFDPVAFQAAGLTFHHADSDKQYWLKDLNNSIPTYSTTSVGAGAVVVRLNKKRNHEVLVTHPLGREHTLWEAPGGGNEIEEYLSDTAERECLEETGVKVDVVGLLGMVNRHKAAPFDEGRNNLHFYYLAKCAVLPETEKKKERPTVRSTLAKLFKSKSDNGIYEQTNEVQDTCWKPMLELITDEAPVRGGFKEMLRHVHFAGEPGIYRTPDYRQETKKEPDPEDRQEVIIVMERSKIKNFFRNLNGEDAIEEEVSKETNEWVEDFKKQFDADAEAIRDAIVSAL